MAKLGSKTKTKKSKKLKKDAASKAINKPLEYADKINKSSLSDETPKGFPQTTSVRVAEKPSDSLLENSGFLLSIAAGIAILLFFASLALPQGDVAISSFGGLNIAEVPLKSAQWAYFLDTLFPMFYGSGLAMLALAHKSRANRQIIRMILTGLLVLVVFDFAENAFVFKAITGDAQSVSLSMVWPVTAVKYGLIAFAGILISMLIKAKTTLETVVVYATRFVFPVLIAILVSGLGGVMAQQIIVASFPAFLILLAVYAFR